MALGKSWNSYKLVASLIATWFFANPVSSAAHDTINRFAGFEPPPGTVWFVAAADRVIDNLKAEDSEALQAFIRNAKYRRENMFPGITALGMPEIFVKSLDDLTSSHPSDINWFPDPKSGFIRHFTFLGDNDVEGPWRELCNRTPKQDKWDAYSGYLLDETKFKGWKRHISEYSGKIGWEKIMVKHADDVAQSDMPWAHKMAFLLLDSSHSDLETYIVEKNRGLFRKRKRQLDYWFVTFSVGPTKDDKIQISATSFRLRLEKNGVHRDSFNFNAQFDK